MNMAGFVNGVSKLHGEVSKKMWVSGFPGVPFNEIPIDSITNGVHMMSHLSHDMYDLLFRYLGEKVVESPQKVSIWESIDDIPDEELWRTHERRRERLVAFARYRLKRQIINKGGSSSEIAKAKEALNPQALTIGFARRFATYKRADLILRDVERLASIMCNTDLPVQIIVAGKAHPRDDEGKKLIQEIISAAKEEHLRKKIVFIENYDMNVARYMVEGCDIWLNNPRRPLEASGTSGMKVIANGGLNFSVLDGWWDEAYHHTLGWKIGNAEEYEDLDYQDEVESRLIYETLEKEIIPTFYERGEDKIPRNWIQLMKSSMKRLGPAFNTNRMVQEYAEKYYFKAEEKRKCLMDNDWKEALEFTKWKTNLLNNWNVIKFKKIEKEHKNGDLTVGAKYIVNAEVELGNLTHEDVEVQIYYGKVDKKEIAHTNEFVTMENLSKKTTKGHFLYKGEILCEASGQFGFTLRILPKHPMLINPFELGLIRWAG